MQIGIEFINIRIGLELFRSAVVEIILLLTIARDNRRNKITICQEINYS